MNKKLREEAIRLRIDKEMSYTAIRSKLGVAKSTLSGWLKGYPLSEGRVLELRRKGWEKGEASREKFRNTMRKKQEDYKRTVYEQEKKRLSCITEDAVYVAGLMLYSAEGSKKDPYRINLANTDPAIILFFIKWMHDFLLVPKSEIKFQLHLYENMDIGAEIDFWKSALCISRRQLYKVQVRSMQKSSFTYRESFRHGTCSLYYSNKEKKTQVMQAIQAFYDLHTA